MGEPLSLSFYNRDAREVAQDLIGKILVRQTRNITLRVRICEVEAYLGELDQASHAYRGRTPRNSVMFGPFGHLYVYFTYGMHYCANIVTGEEGVPQAVLLRAAQPLEGIAVMEANRKLKDPLNLCSGPAKLAQALAISKLDNGTSLTSGQIWLEDDGLRMPTASSPRIGISRSTEALWRFYIPGSAFVSKKTALAKQSSTTHPK